MKPIERDEGAAGYDPQLFDDQLEVWTLIIQKFTVIPPSLMPTHIYDIVLYLCMFW